MAGDATWSSTCDLSAFVIVFALFVFIDPAPPEIYTLSLHDALPISTGALLPPRLGAAAPDLAAGLGRRGAAAPRDRKSTRLNSSHVEISYAVFCLKKKKWC